MVGQAVTTDCSNPSLRDSRRAAPDPTRRGCTTVKGRLAPYKFRAGSNQRAGFADNRHRKIQRFKLRAAGAVQCRSDATECPGFEPALRHWGALSIRRI